MSDVIIYYHRCAWLVFSDLYLSRPSTGVENLNCYYFFKILIVRWICSKYGLFNRWYTKDPGPSQVGLDRQIPCPRQNLSDWFDVLSITILPISNICLSCKTSEIWETEVERWLPFLKQWSLMLWWLRFQCKPI